MKQQLTLIRPDDWHLHLRDMPYLADTVGYSSRQFARAIIMPNLNPPVTTIDQALAYRRRIIEQIPSGHQFTPLMTLYLTDNTDVQTVIDAAGSEMISAFKLYPSGATTNSDAGVTDILHCYPLFEAMQKHGIALLIHGEVTQSEVDIFDREKYFIEQQLIPLRQQFPQLKIVFEHITTREAVDYIEQSNEHTAATITAHHLLMNRNDMLAGGIRPHYYCLPILKKNHHQQALIKAATSGSPRYFLGTDSAPHALSKKQSSCGCAGIFTAHAAIELYAEAFDRAHALDKLEQFASLNGPDFYGLARNSDTIRLIRQDWQVESALSFAEEQLIPFRAQQMIHWKVDEIY